MQNDMVSAADSLLSLKPKKCGLHIWDHFFKIPKSN